MDSQLGVLIAKWGSAWGLPDLASSVSVSFSPRMRKSLGRCHPSTGQITLRADLRKAPRERMAAVLCHEAAHVATFRLFGPAARPHGPEWKKLVSSAGFQPEVRTVLPAGQRPPTRNASSILPYEHRCPVCQSVRYARRPVRRWHCVECFAAGLGGELVITRHQAQSPI